MKGLTEYITQSAWCDILTVEFVLVDDSYQQMDPSLRPNRKFAPQGTPQFSDSEVITIALFAETVFNGDEDKTLHFIRQYHLDMFPQLLDKSRFNRRRRQLTKVMEAIREHLRDCWRAAHPLDEDEAHLRLVDSAPISICTYTRGSRCRTIPLDWRDEWFGVCTSKKSKFFGPRCHLTTTIDQMIDSWLLAPGSYDDRKPMAALLENRQGLGVIGDKGYVSQDLAEAMFLKTWLIVCGKMASICFWHSSVTIKRSSGRKVSRRYWAICGIVSRLFLVCSQLYLTLNVQNHVL